MIRCLAVSNILRKVEIENRKQPTTSIKMVYVSFISTIEVVLRNQTVADRRALTFYLVPQYGFLLNVDHIAFAKYSGRRTASSHSISSWEPYGRKYKGNVKVQLYKKAFPSIETVLPRSIY